MVSQDHSLVFFCYINEARTILCGSLKKVGEDWKHQEIGFDLELHAKCCELDINMLWLFVQM
jgi:hypothetical protein